MSTKGQDVTYEDLPAAAREAVHAARNAQQTIEVARAIQIQEAADHAAEKAAQRTKTDMLDALMEVFGNDNKKDPAQMSVLVQRVPLLCRNVEQTHQDIGEIKESLKELKDVVDRKYVTIEMFSPVKLISYGTVAFLTSVCLAALVSKLIS